MIGEIIKSVKDWTIALVLTQNHEFTSHAYWSLFGIAFIESSFFPIPPDIPFILMGVAVPKAALYLALLLTCGSVLGAVLGYFIGLYGGRPVVDWLVTTRFISRIFSREKFDLVEDYYNRYDTWAVLTAAFTPIPYKIFTIGAGLCRINFWRFLLASIVGRAGRFFLVGTVLYWFGEHAKGLLRHFDLFLVGMLVLGIAGFAVMAFLKPAKNPSVGE